MRIGAKPPQPPRLYNRAQEAEGQPAPDNVALGSTKVWLVHGSYTGGHASAARSLKAALESHPGVSAEIINVAETSQSESPASTAAEVALKGGSWMKSIRRWVFDQQYEGNSLVKWAGNQYMSWEAGHQQPFLDRLKSEKPDILISTMSATNSMLSQWAETGEIKQPLQSVLTDFASHQMWAQENIAHYYVATPQVEQDLEKFGVNPEKVSITGIPINSKFSEPSLSPQDARKKLGLPPEKPLLLMLGGSLGYGAFSENLSALDQVDGDFQMAAITGKNKQLQSELESLELEKDLSVQGYVTNMSTWLDAADIVVTKPGGLTSSEILAKGKPMLLQRANSGLEARLVDRLEETGAAVVVDGTEDLAQTVSALMKDQARLATLKEKARQFGKPNSSQQIADKILASISC